MKPIQPNFSLLLVALTTVLVNVRGGLLRGQAVLQLEQEKDGGQPFKTSFAFPLQLLVETASSSSISTVNNDALWDRKENILRDSYYYYEDLVVSPSPTMDLCYGNMGRNGPRKHVWCHSQMPSVSLEPSQQDTILPPSDTVVPSLSLTPPPSSSATPSVVVMPQRHSATPSFSPSNVPLPTIAISPTIGLCAGDCNSPTDCAEGLYCFERVNFEAVPGCPGTELDGSRTDYCTNVTITASPSPSTTDENDDDNDSFRLKLYWNESYWWQASNIEIAWCMACQKLPQDDGDGGGQTSLCQEGDPLFLHYCSNEAFVVSFDFVNGLNSNSTILIHVFESELCLERQALDTMGGSSSSATTSTTDGSGGGAGGVTLQACNTTNPLQNWVAGVGDDYPTENNNNTAPFEISVPSHPGVSSSSSLCLTIHHHPKLGEEIGLYLCQVARQDNSSLWDRIV